MQNLKLKTPILEKFITLSLHNLFLLEICSCLSENCQKTFCFAYFFNPRRCCYVLLTFLKKKLFNRWQKKRTVESGGAKDVDEKSVEAQPSAGVVETTSMGGGTVSARPLSSHMKRFLSIVEHELDVEPHLEPDHQTTTGSNNHDDNSAQRGQLPPPKFEGEEKLLSYGNFLPQNGAKLKSHVLSKVKILSTNNLLW